MIWFFALPISIALIMATVPALASDEVARCNQLISISLTESELFPVEKQNQELSPFIGQCISSTLLGNLVSTVSAYYQQRGFITTRAYLQAQDVSQGDVVVSVLIGRVEDVVLVTEAVSVHRIPSLFPESNEILELSRLESAIETIERVPSATASFSLVPGKRPGNSNIEVSIVDDTPWGMEAGVLARSDDNADLVFNFRLDNPLQINDVLWLRYNSGQVATAAAASFGSEIEYSLPLRTSLLTFSARDFSFKQTIQGQNGSYLSTGETQTLNANWSVPISSLRNGLWKIAALLNSERSRSFFENEPVDVSSYDSSEWGLSLRYRSAPTAGLDFGFEYKYLVGEGDSDDDYFNGIEGFDSTADVNAARQLLTADLQIPTIAPVQSLKLRFAGQAASDLLRQNRKLSLGGFSTVRGYQSALSGSEGWVINADYVWSWTDEKGKTIQANLGLDYGEISCEVDNPDICGDISGAGFGWTLFDANFSAQFLAGFPLEDLPQSDVDQQQLLLNLLWRL